MRIDREAAAVKAQRAVKRGSGSSQTAAGKMGKMGKTDKISKGNGVPASMETVHAGHASYRIATHAQLVRSALNVRRKSAGSVAELAALIRSQGLLQNLICYEEQGMLHVVAGERRREAIGQLIGAGDLPPDFGIACLLVPVEEAIAISLAENSGREAMHPADAFEAMRELASRGAGIEDIALSFGITPLTVRRRLKLASVAPRFMTLYRQDEVSFEQLAALAICDDHATQEQVWDSLEKWARGASNLRRLLTAQHIDLRQDRVARYVGAAAFEQAGGVIVRDLFSEEGAGYIEDGALLERLASEKLAQAAEPLAKEGWAWIEIKPRATDADLAEYGRVRTVQRALTDAEQDEVASLNGAIEAARDELDALEECQEEGSGEEGEGEQSARSGQIASLHARWDALDAQLAALYDRLRSAHAGDRLLAGAVVSISDMGTLRVQRDLIRPGHKCRVEPDKTDLCVTDKPVKTRLVHSEKLVRILTAQRTVALHAELMARPAVALAVLVHDLACSVFRPFQTGRKLAQVSLTMPVLPEDVNECKAMEAVKARRAELAAMLPACTSESTLLTWMLAQPQSTLLDLLAFCMGCALDTVQSHDVAHAGFAELAGAVGLDMRTWWQPTALNYLSHVPKSRVLDVAGLATSPDKAQPLLSMTKQAMVQRAEQMIAGSGWLPEPLRTKLVAA